MGHIGPGQEGMEKESWPGMSWGRQRQPVFSAPGKATAWGVIGCWLSFPAAGLWGWHGILGVTIIAALAGCINP